MLPNPTPPSSLNDAQGRRMRYLRMSVTDRCNFRCTYCSPASWGGKRDLLTTDEVVRIGKLFVGLGIERIRLTGGEPLLRPDLIDILSRLRETPGLRHLALTTNASRLEELAKPLRDAGLDHLNISLDTLDADRFRALTPRGDFGDVLRGIDAAAAAGFASVKLNSVVIDGVNDDEVAALVRYAHDRFLVPRFIELMPFGKGKPVPTARLVASLRSAGIPLTPFSSDANAVRGPARYYLAPTGRVGFISPMTENFCGGCNRLRIASNGDLRACLGGREQAPLSKLIRDGVSDDVLIAAVQRALGEKVERHAFNEPSSHGELLSMMGIGG